MSIKQRNIYKIRTSTTISCWNKIKIKITEKMLIVFAVGWTNGPGDIESQEKINQQLMRFNL